MDKFKYNGSKVYEIYPNIKNTKINYINRYNISIFADIFFPENFDANKKYPAIIVGHPHGGVKEQSSGLYAQEMASKGFIAIAFDNSYNGESGGNARKISSPETFVEDIIASVDFIGTREFVDRERIGLIGVCASGAFSINAASLDPRIKAVVTASMYDMGEYTRKAFGTLNSSGRKALLEKASLTRWEDMKNGTITHDAPFPTSELPDEMYEAMSLPAKRFLEYYATPLGRHSQSVGAFTTNSIYALMNFFPFANINLLEGRPLLIISGDVSHSKVFSDKAFELAPEPKEYHIVEGATHVDLYHDKTKIPFDKINKFFTENL